MLLLTATVEGIVASIAELPRRPMSLSGKRGENKR
jgi:hypothetical protein